jgi:signal transduction histidine kinase
VGQAILGQGAVDNLPIDQISETYQAYIAGTDQLYPTEQLPAVRALQGDGIIIDDVEIAVNGRRVPLEVHTIPVFDANGDVIYAINAFQDVTERRRAEQLQAHYNRDLERQVAAQTAALQASEARRRAILSAIPDQILLVNRQGTYLDFMSPASDPFPQNGHPQGQTLFQRLPEAVASRYLKAVQLALDSDDQQVFQQHQIDPTKGPSYSGDRFRYEEVRVLPCGDNTALILVRDVTERHEVNRMKDEFISIVTHELKTPLTSIRASLGLLDSGLLADDPETTQRMLHVASQSSDRLVRLVNDILNLERLEAGKVQLVMQPCPIDSLMQQAVQAMEAIALESSVTLSIEALPEQVWAAPDAIVQTLINLVCNAIKYSPAGGIVWLKAEKVDEWASGQVGEWAEEQEPGARSQVPGTGSQVPGTGFQVLDTNNSGQTQPPPIHSSTHRPIHPSTILFSITDQGRGIPADKLETIFGRFQQIDSSDSREKGGTGLGLAICKSIIQQHGGRIWATSELNQGSTFYFTLPSVPSDSEQSA